MSALSNYAEGKLLEHIVGKTAYIKPTTYVALYTAAPTDSTTGTEVGGNAYARVTTTATDWNASTGGQITNAVNFEWPQATGIWGTIVAIALVDAPTGGNVLVYGNTNAAKVIEAGDTYRVAAGNFELTMN